MNALTAYFSAGGTTARAAKALAVVPIFMKSDRLFPTPARI